MFQVLNKWYDILCNRCYHKYKLMQDSPVVRENKKINSWNFYCTNCQREVRPLVLLKEEYVEETDYGIRTSLHLARTYELLERNSNE